MVLTVTPGLILSPVEAGYKFSKMDGIIFRSPPNFLRFQEATRVEAGQSASGVIP
jgi:hypothetical protein